ncbi:MAG: Aerotolerance protein BatA [uncultured Chloroflexia bacterium]|uniref:Aerotolerance protein BatA n=1 Tax=uncultured Chloroflexia bacterium TaxID=1672391 RepID=A0A6J4HXT8_9CHLR|nr:MAG: Aerotolerance protein BatA [uncultured Chloroflexia bacterium]
MSLLWPGFLLLLGIVPLLIAAYIWSLRRRRVALRYSSLSLIRAAIPPHARLRRHLPFALLLLGLTSMIFALVRPVRMVTVPSGQATIMLAMDVSGSMRQTDIEPSRLRAAQAAAVSFVQRPKRATQIGMVAFAGYAELVQPPTTNREALQIAVESLTMARGTAIGSGILEALDAIAEIDPNVAPSETGEEAPVEPRPTPVPQGAYVPHIIVVLTDGVTTTGPQPLEAARQAADRGVRVYTIGFGTQNGSPGFGGPQFGGNQQSGRRFRRGIDEPTMKQIAEMTGGEYYAASSAGELVEVFENLPTHVTTKTEVMEISVVFAGVAALLAAVAMVLSLRWHPLP